MTVETLTGDIDVIEIRGQPGDRRMTIVAVFTAGDVIGCFAGCRCAVVAGTATAQDLCMVNRRRRCENDGVVAVLTDIGGLNVLSILADRRSTIVAADAVARDTGMIEDGGQPGGRIVAIVALVVRGDMCWRLAGRLHAVVTADAAAG